MNPLKTSKIKYLTKENELNKLIREHKSSRVREYILFTSLWDPVSCSLVDKISKMDTNKSINIINSFDTPHSFVIWGLTKAPSLVILESYGGDRKVSTTTHVTEIYKRLGLEK